MHYWRGVIGLLLGLSGCVWWLAGTPELSTPTVAGGTPTLTLPTVTPTPAPTPWPGPGLEAAAVHLFPWPLAAGDTVSLDVVPRLPVDSPQPFTLTVTLPNAPPLVTAVVPQGLDGVPRARFYWAWTTTGLTGLQWLTFTLTGPPGLADPDPADNQLSLPVQLQPPETLPPPEPATRWMVTTTTGISLSYLTHTAAERDLPRLVAEAQSAYCDITARLGQAAEPTRVYLLDRVVGQGGYASADWLAVTYTDRQYALATLPMLLRHELVHRLDGSLGCQQAPALWREGLAVYIPGGHYRPEPVPEEAAFLLATGRLIPLAELVEGFYTHQHEIGYLEAGALVAYVVEQHGWEGVQGFCQTATRTSGGEREQLEAGLQALGAADLTAFEQAWQSWLRTLPITTQEAAALELELQLMELLRDYQARYDPAAHFLSGILFDPQAGAAQGITADFVRRPRDPEALALELLLQTAGQRLAANDFVTTAAILKAVAATLHDGFPATGLAAEARAISRAVLAAGYEPYQLNCDAFLQRCQVAVLDRQAWPTPHLFTAIRINGRWALRPVTGPDSTGFHNLR